MPASFLKACNRENKVPNNPTHLPATEDLLAHLPTHAGQVIVSVRRFKGKPEASPS